MVCPITGIRSYIESAATDKTMPFLIKSNALHVFEYSIFGMNIRLPLWGSYFAEQLLYEYATDTVVTLKCNEKTLSGKKL